MVRLRQRERMSQLRAISTQFLKHSQLTGRAEHFLPYRPRSKGPPVERTERWPSWKASAKSLLLSSNRISSTQDSLAGSTCPTAQKFGEL
jgi:hypothetical protein